MHIRVCMYVYVRACACACVCLCACVCTSVGICRSAIWHVSGEADTSQCWSEGHGGYPFVFRVQALGAYTCCRLIFEVQRTTVKYMNIFSRVCVHVRGVGVHVCAFTCWHMTYTYILSCKYMIIDVCIWICGVYMHMCTYDVCVYIYVHIVHKEGYARVYTYAHIIYTPSHI